MHDLGSQADPIQDIKPDDARERRRRIAAILAVILLLLLLLCCCSVVTGSLVKTTPPSARYIVDNRACLECHTELLPEFNLASVHSPFEKKNCTICHTDHGQLWLRQQTPGKLVVFGRCGVVVTFEPLRRVLAACGSCGRVSGPGGCGACGRVADLGKRETTLGSTDATGAYARKPSHLTSPEPTLCFTCHRNEAQMRSKQFQHNPFQKGRCTSACHKPHASSFTWLLKAPTKVLCPSCHRLVEDLALPDLHPPFEQRLCTSCHQPHASDFKGILVTNQRALCFSCHPQIASLVNLPVQHSPFINGQCTGCHKPHSSVARPLLITNQPPLCYRCHPAIQNDFLKPSHHPVGTPLLNCSDCHGPHAAMYRYLLVAKDNKLCYTCHGDKEFCYVRSKHDRAVLFGARGLCINCHTPHGSVWAPLLIKNQQATCLQCHPTKISRVDIPIRSRPPSSGSGAFNHNNHPVWGGWRDPIKGGRLTCTSSCHDPHGTCRRAMLKRLPDGLCLRCHPVGKLP